MEWLGGIVALIVAGFVAWKAIKRDSWWQRKQEVVLPPKAEKRTVEQNKAIWDEAWRNAVAAGMDPDSQSAQGFIRSARLSLGWSWNPPGE